MAGEHPQHTLRIAGVFDRKSGMQNDIWRGASVCLHQLPRCVPFLFNEDVPTAQLADWRPDGLIVHCSQRKLYDRLARLDVPMVNTSGQLDRLPIPTITPDNRACGAVAARFLLANGYRHFAFLGFLDRAFSVRRLQGFRDAIEHGDGTLAVYEGEVPGWVSDGLDLSPAGHALTAWIAGLHEGAAIMTMDDHIGVVLTQHMQVIGLEAAGRFGIISGHDRVTPNNPPLTAVRMPEERWGYEAARLLVDMVRRGARRADDILLPPLGIAERESTSGMATDDPFVIGAMRYIRSHAADTISVGDVARAVSLGRRALERRFVNAMRRTILQEIHRAHVEHAKQLLIDTDMSMQAVAVESGLTDEKQLRRLFQHHEGTTPAAYRRRHRIT